MCLCVHVSVCLCLLLLRVFVSVFTPVCIFLLPTPSCLSSWIPRLLFCHLPPPPPIASWIHIILYYVREVRETTSYPHCRERSRSSSSSSRRNRSRSRGRCRRRSHSRRGGRHAGSSPFTMDKERSAASSAPGRDDSAETIIFRTGFFVTRAANWSVGWSLRVNR